LFGNLPTELRFKIWELSLPEPRTFANDTIYVLMTNPSRYSNSYRIPPACHVCIESASVVRNSHFESCYFKGTNPTTKQIRIYFKPNHDIYIIRLCDLERRFSYIKPSLVQELVVDLKHCSPDTLRGLDMSWFNVYTKLKTIVLMGSRYNRTIDRCSECNMFAITLMGCGMCVDRGRCLPAMQHALMISRQIQNVVVKHVDDDTYDYPYLDSLEVPAVSY